MNIKRSLFPFALACATLLSGCASNSQKVMHERGWIGGQFANVRPAGKVVTWQSDDSISALPEMLRAAYRGGLLVTGLAAESPLAKAGVVEGDLILAAAGAPVVNARQLHELIDVAKAGAPIDLLIFRDGETTHRNVVVGREKFRTEHTIALAVGLSTRLDFDLIPNPDFSLV